MHPHSFLWRYLWIAPHALQIIIAIVMVRRGLFREYPLFFAYTVFQIMEGGTLFVLDHIDAVSGDQYWLTHRVCQMFDTALRFAIIFEIFSSVFGKNPGLKSLTCVVFARIVGGTRVPGWGTPRRSFQSSSLESLGGRHAERIAPSPRRICLLFWFVRAQPRLWLCLWPGNF